MSIRLPLATLAACLSFPSLPAAGAERGFYGGGGYVQSSFDAKQQPFDAVMGTVYDAFGFTVLDYAPSFDDEDSGYEFLVGYRFLPWLAFEAGYLDAGEIKHRATAQAEFEGEPLTLDSSLATEVAGFAVSALTLWQATERFSLYARAGLLFANNETNLSLTDGVGRASDSASNSSESFLWGAGIGMGFAEIYTVRLEYRQIMDVGDEDLTGESDAEVLTLGFTVAFAF